MAEIHVRGVGAGLMRDVKIAALKSGMTLREWVIEAVERAVGHGAGEEDRLERNVQAQRPQLPERCENSPRVR
jgi:hypothetical protein